MSTNARTSITGVNRRILVIDDNEMIHQDFAKILAPPPSQDGAIDQMASSLFGAAEGGAPADAVRFDLTSALQGEDGVRVACSAREKGEPFALAFVDMRMPPGWDGLETISRMWVLDSEVQIVICTAYSDQSWEEITERLGQSDRLLILKKPFDAVEVLQLAHALTTKWSLAEKVRDHLRQLERLVEERTADLRKTNGELTLEISQHQRAIRRLAEVKLKIEQMLEVLPLVLIGVGRDGVISHWNSVAHEFFGIASEKAIGSTLGKLSLRMNAADIEAILAAARRGSPAAEREIAFAHADGKEGVLLVAAAPMPGGDGFLIYGIDLTHRRMLEAHLLQAQKLEAIGQLAAGVAHEINTPVQYIGDNLRFLKTAFDDLDRALERYRELSMLSTDARIVAARSAAESMADLPYIRQEVGSAIEQSVEGVQQIGKIVSAMRDFSHPATRTRRWIGLAAIIESALNVSRNEYKYVADVVVDIPNDLPKLSGYVVQLNQVVLNLVVNAAHAIAAKGASERGKIAISARVVGACIELRIADTGCGIPERMRHHIFEPFFTTKAVGQGTGQGLYLCREFVVKQHGGDLSFTSSEGHGTTFIIRLPIEGGGVDAASAAASLE